MAQLPKAPWSQIRNAPLEVRDYIKRLENLAKDGVKFRNQVSAEFKIGKVSKDAEGELDIQIKIITKRGNKTASNIHLKQLYINGEPMINGDPEVTNANGVWSKLYHTEPVDFLELELEIEQNGETKKFSDVLVIQMPKEKRPNELMIIIPEANKDNVVIKLQDSFGFTVSLQTLLDKTPTPGTVHIISDFYFQYAVDGQVSKASKKHLIKVDGSLTIELLPLHDYQKITFFAEGIKPQTFLFKKQEF